MAGRQRRVWQIVLSNFINSLKPRQLRGNLIGKDYIGNQYYEIPAKPQEGKRKPVRSYEPPKGLDFQDPLPSEWMAWLRLTRVDPPTEEEISKNLAISDMKKINAKNIEAKRLLEGGSVAAPSGRGPQSFPTYEEFSRDDPYKK